MMDDLDYLTWEIEKAAAQLHTKAAKLIVNEVGSLTVDEENDCFGLAELMQSLLFGC